MPLSMTAQTIPAPSEPNARTQASALITFTERSRCASSGLSGHIL